MAQTAATLVQSFHHFFILVRATCVAGLTVAGMKLTSLIVAKFYPSNRFTTGLEFCSHCIAIIIFVLVLFRDLIHETRKTLRRSSPRRPRNSPADER
jgi:hypothetical protein